MKIDDATNKACAIAGNYDGFKQYLREIVTKVEIDLEKEKLEIADVDWNVVMRAVRVDLNLS